MESLDQKNYNQKINYLTIDCIAIFIVKIIIIFWLTVPVISFISYETYKKIINNSLTPFKDFFFEYPPFFALFNIFPFGLIKIENEFEHLLFINILMLIFELIAMKISLKILTKLNGNKIEILKKMKFYFIWFFLTLCLSFFVYQCVEYASVLIFTLGILFFDISNHKHNFKFYLLSIVGIFTKIISSLNLPLAVFFHSYEKSKTLSEFIFLTFKNTLFLILLIFLATLTFEYFFDFKMIKDISSQFFRDIDVLSVSGSYVFLTNLIFDMKSEVFLSMNHAIKPNIYTNIFFATHLFKIIYFLFVLGVFIILAFNKKNNKQIPIDLLLFTEGSATIILIFLSFHNVGSPQFIAYLIPFASILAIHYRSKKLLYAFLIIFIFTTILFPLFHTNLIENNIIIISILIIRNLTILFTCFYFIFKFYQKILKPLKNLPC